MWFAVYELANGRLESVGETVVDDVTLTAKGFAKKEFASRPDQGQVWNPVLLVFEAPPAVVLSPDRLAADSLLTKGNWTSTDTLTFQKLILKANKGGL